MMNFRNAAAMLAAFLAFMPTGRASVKTNIPQPVNSGAGLFVLSIASVIGWRRERDNEDAPLPGTPARNVAPDSSWAPDPKAFGVKTSGHVVALYVDPAKARAFLYDTREIVPPRLARMPLSIMPRREN